MSRDASVLLTFPDGEEYNFRLAWGQLIKLQEARNAGPFVIYMRLHDQTWMVEDIREVIRLGLIGGGMDPVKAKKLILEYIESTVPLASLPLAQRIMLEAVVGPEDEEEIEKKSMAASNSQTSATVESASPPSMEPVH
jgi:hypothetical protein